MAKPIGYVLNTGHALVSGRSLIFATVFDQGSGNPTDLVTGASATPVGGAAWTTMANGDPGRIYTSDGAGDYFSTFDSQGMSSALTLVAISEATDGVQSGCALATKADGNNALYDWFFYRSGGTDNLTVRVSGTTQDSGLTAVGKTFYAVATDATNTIWNIDGSTATTATVTLGDQLKRLVVGGRWLTGTTYDFAAGGGIAGKGKISAAYWWNSKLSAAELASLQGDPWQFLQPGGAWRYPYDLWTKHVRT